MPFNNSRNAILEALKARLLTITEENDYQTNVGRVERYALDISQIAPSDFPALSIFDDGGEETIAHSTADPEGPVRLRVSIVGFVHDGDEKSLSETFNKFKADLDRCIWSSPTLAGTNCQDLLLQSYLPIETQYPFVIFQANVELTYWFLKANP